MSEREFDSRWHDRAARYAKGASLPLDSPVHISVEPRFGSTYSGQVAAVTAASLFGRMTKRVSFDVAAQPIHNALPWSGASLDEVVEETLRACHRFGQYEQRAARDGDTRLVVGAIGDGLLMHGSGWNGYCGIDPSPLEQSTETNPFGAAFAVVLGAATLQQSPRLKLVRASIADTFRWVDTAQPSNGTTVTPDFEVGELWDVGAGSVGSSALFFLGLITRAFRAVLIDGDRVELENVTRTPVYTWMDGLEEPWKVDALGQWLSAAGVEQVEIHRAWLDEIRERWVSRQSGTPDVIIAAANERNVRNLIEEMFPPIQIYATTGRNWQATLFRHIPVKEACSLCVPGSEGKLSVPLCATGTSQPGPSQEVEDDVALPFLSFAAGVMSAAEIAKIAITGRASSTNRVFFEPSNRGLIRVALSAKPDCACGRRDPVVHRSVIAGSRFAALSDM
ncbi:MAG: hypothetical protein F4X58_12640 [Chloroflexi bacterium]|nr:hypothetical protein [Chloroflexota bacterium]MYC02758.1 hypothetical protein [Chloroflexota bacterium]